MGDGRLCVRGRPCSLYICSFLWSDAVFVMTRVRKERTLRTLMFGPVIRPNAAVKPSPIFFPASRRFFAGSHKRAGS